MAGAGSATGCGLVAVRSVRTAGQEAGEQDGEGDDHEGFGCW